MQDSEKNYPSQPIPSRHAHHSTDDASLEVDDSEYGPAEIQLPSHGLLYAIIIGVFGGLIAASIPIAIVLVNASVYQEAARLALLDKISPNQMNTIWTTVQLGCLGTFIDFLLSFAVGYIVGRIAVLRRRGFLAGALVGAITYLGYTITLYLPNYPGKIASTTPPPSGTILPGILTTIVIFLIYSAIAALIALWGAWAATRKHPYYQLQAQE